LLGGIRLYFVGEYYFGDFGRGHFSDVGIFPNLLDQQGELARIRGLGGSGAVDIARNANFGTENGNLFWRGDSELHLGRGSLENFDLDILADYYGLTATPANDKH